MLVLTQTTVGIFLATSCAPQKDLLPAVSVVGDGWDVGLQDLSMEHGSILHLPLAEDSAKLDEGVNVICRVEERKALRQEGEQYDAATPHVDEARLGCALQQDFRRAEASSSRPVGTSRRALVFLRV